MKASLLLAFVLLSSGLLIEGIRSHGEKEDLKEKIQKLKNYSYWDAIKVNANGGGANCAACTIVVSLIDQMAEINNKEVGK